MWTQGLGASKAPEIHPHPAPTPHRQLGPESPLQRPGGLGAETAGAGSGWRGLWVGGLGRARVGDGGGRVVGAEVIVLQAILFCNCPAPNTHIH